MKPGDTTIGTCRTCDRPVIRGLNDEICGWPVTLDPAPISAAAELGCLATGRDICSYWPAPDGRPGSIHRRDPWQLKGRLAGRAMFPPGALVLAGHRCGEPPLPADDGPPPVLQQRHPTPVEVLSTPPPY